MIIGVYVTWQGSVIGFDDVSETDSIASILQQVSYKTRSSGVYLVKQPMILNPARSVGSYGITDGTILLAYKPDGPAPKVPLIPIAPPMVPLQRY